MSPGVTKRPPTSMTVRARRAPACSASADGGDAAARAGPRVRARGPSPCRPRSRRCRRPGPPAARRAPRAAAPRPGRPRPGAAAARRPRSRPAHAAIASSVDGEPEPSARSAGHAAPHACEPVDRIELSTYGLRNRCSTTELHRHQKRLKGDDFTRQRAQVNSDRCGESRATVRPRARPGRHRRQPDQQGVSVGSGPRCSARARAAGVGTIVVTGTEWRAARPRRIWPWRTACTPPPASIPTTPRTA